ncbi:MAG: helix-turn-helix transcriptional regulator [Eubacteriaceae bacterium]|nr:helix-turn-helix transcriptional regulator [Eubacteriaceae bacterium]
MQEKCHIESTLSLISGKWKILILKELIIEPVRYNVLIKKIPNISAKVLTQQLKDMESDGIILREVYAEIPPRVEYSLSKKGRSMLRILKEMAIWGLENDKDILSKCPECKQCEFIN